MKNNPQKYVTKDEKIINVSYIIMLLSIVVLDITLILSLSWLSIFSWYGLLCGVLAMIFNAVSYFFLKYVLYTRKYIIFDSERQKIIQVFKNQKKKQIKNFNYKDIIGYKVERGNKINAKNARKYDWWFPNQTDSGASWLMYGYIEIEGNRYVCIITSISRRRVEKELSKIKRIIEQG